MTKKNYIAIARLIASNTENDSIVKSRFVANLSSYLRSDNPRFNSNKFIEACNESK